MHTKRTIYLLNFSYLESHKDWFNEDNYVRGNVNRKNTTTLSTDTTKTEDTETVNNVTVLPDVVVDQAENNDIPTTLSITTSTSTITTQIGSVVS